MPEQLGLLLGRDNAFSLEKPFPRSYWVLPGRLLAGAYPGSPNPKEMAQKMSGLLQAGVRRIINLMEPDETNWDGELFTPYEKTFKLLAARTGLQVETVRHPIVDQNIPSKKLMKTILDDIDRSLDSGKGAYVHCWGGKGRTGTVVGCFLIRHALANREIVLDKIQELRKNDPKAMEPSPENGVQEHFVLSWK